MGGSQAEKARRGRQGILDGEERALGERAWPPDVTQDATGRKRTGRGRGGVWTQQAYQGAVRL